MNIREKITAWEPGAVWSEAGDGMFTVPVEKFHALAARLRAEGFDFLLSLTGMDWGEEGFGAVYHLEATATGENVVLRTLTPSREKCGTHPSQGTDRSKIAEHSSEKTVEQAGQHSRKHLGLISNHIHLEESEIPLWYLCRRRGGNTVRI